MAASFSQPDELKRIWDEQPGVIRIFMEVRPQYEELCKEVEYILRKRMDESSLEYSAITSRAKTLRSFANKIARKNYEEPLRNITDLAGVRVVYLYKSDRSAIEKIIENEFVLIEKVDKLDEQDADKFGYGALHYLVRLGRKSSGARYDDLKTLVCEIQVRTVGQDAWAIIDHHLSYKQESDVPKILRRKINSLSGFFETADDQFDRVRADREQYRKAVKGKLESQDRSLDQEFNLDTFTEYLRWRFPNRIVTDDENRLTFALSKAAEYGYESLKDVDDLLMRTERARKAMAKKIPVPAAVGEVIRAIAFEHPAYRRLGWGSSSLFEEYDSLLTR